MSSTMSSTTFKTNEYIGQTTRTSRPVVDDARIYRDPADLAAHQARWDAAETQRLHNQRQQDERNAEVERTRLAEIEQRQVAARADLESALKREFMSNAAATIADWDAVKDQKVREYLMASNPVAEARAELVRAGAGPRF